MSNDVNEMKEQYNEIRGDMNNRFDINDAKFDELNNSLCKRIDERFNTIKKQMQDDAVNMRKRKESTRNTGKCSENRICLLYTSGDKR